MPKERSFEFTRGPLSQREIETKARDAIENFRIKRGRTAWPLNKEKRDLALEEIRKEHASGSLESEEAVIRAIGLSKQGFRGSLGAWTGRTYVHGGREVLLRILEILDEEERANQK